MLQLTKRGPKSHASGLLRWAKKRDSPQRTPRNAEENRCGTVPQMHVSVETHKNYDLLGTMNFEQYLITFTVPTL